MTTTVIDIVAKVTDQTSSGTSSAVKNLSKIEQAGLSMQKTLTNVKSMSKIEVAASLKDAASAGLSGIVSLGKSLTGKVYSVTSKLIDYATAPIRSILNLVKNPIVQTVTLMGVTAGVSDTIATYASYEQTLADTKAVTGASDAEIASIGTVVKDLGATTTFSAAEVGAGASVLGTAGWNASQIQDGLGGIVTMAQAGSVDIATAADINTSTIAQYKLNSSDSGYVGDVLAATAASSKTDISGLGESLKYVGSTASALEYSLEDTAIAMGLMGNSAIDGSQAGTSFRALLTNLIDPTKDTATAMTTLGISLSDQNGEMYSLMDVMTQLRSSFSSLTSEEQALYASSLAGTEGMSGLLAIANAGEDDFNTLTEAIYGSAGAAQSMADIRVDSLSGDFAALSSAVDGVKISIGERLAPTLRSFVQMATEYVPLVGEQIDSLLANSQIRFSTVVDSPEWQTASFSEKITLTWDAMVGDPFTDWWNSSGRESVTNLSSNAGETLGSVLSGGLMTLLGIDIGDTASEGMKVGQAFVTGFMDGFDFDGVAQGLLNAFSSVANEAGKIFTGDATASSYLAAGAMAYGGVKVASGVSNVAQIAKGTWDAGKAVYGAGASLLGVAKDTSVGSKVLSSAGTIGKTLGYVGMTADGIGGAMNAQSWLGGTSLKETLISGIGGLLGGTGNGFGNAISGAAKGAMVGSTMGAVGTGVGAVVGGVSGAIGGEKISQGIEQYMETVSLAMTTFWEETGQDSIAGMGSFFGTIGTAFSTFCDETGNLWQTKKEEAYSFCSETINWFFETASQTFSNLWTETDAWFQTKKAEATSFLSTTITNFFSNLSSVWTTFWSSAYSFVTSSIPGALSSLSSSASGFFSGVSSAVSGFFSNALSSALSFVSNGISNITSLAIPAYAEGGILSSPHVGLVAEDGPEAIIPLGGKRRSRGIALWEEAGRHLGVHAYAEGGIVGNLVPMVATATPTTGGGMVVPVTIGNITFQVNADKGSFNEQDLLALLKANIADLTDEIANQLAKCIKQSFSNMPILS